MKKKISLLIVCCLMVVITACSQTANSSEGNESQLKEENSKLTKQVNENAEKLKELTKKLEEQNKQLEDMTKEKENFVFVSNLSRDFVQAHTTGDEEKLRELVSEDVVIENRENNIYAIIKGHDYEWELFNNEASTQLDDWVIQGYEYDRETDTYSLNMREFITDENGEPVTPPTFLSLTFKYVGEDWKIISISFDV
ncbi:hypothetical protein [Fredinandcohnia quinoae]|uniref:Uncharacterized protein n=1 Tax=Fredinandcohnia quinoae TaxID=2918902 RepID=A0AAW5E1C5_9BACI|nr:hypothetical protein [Fredinandcohnia sp. SECRCQ15]MCH1626717.1 hypothetical protein [Fredinandcohnia sp. SECRCQ15]